MPECDIPPICHIHRAVRGNPAAPSCALIALLFAVLSGCAAPGPSGDQAAAPSEANGVRTTPVVAGRPARVFVMTAVGKNCEQLAPPEISITEKPGKGDVAFTPGQDTTIATTAQGTCIGQKAKGTGIYYTARAGSTGADHFSVNARLASGETATRTFEVQIVE